MIPVEVVDKYAWISLQDLTNTVSVEREGEIISSVTGLATAEAIHTTVVPMSILIRTTVVPITPLIGTTVVQIRILIGTTGI